MAMITPMFACRMEFTAGDAIFIYSILGMWLVGAILSLANLFLIIITGTPKFKMANFGVFLSYIAAPFVIFNGVLGIKFSDNSIFILIPIYGIPSLAILHFCYLIRVRRRLKKKADKHDT